MWSELTKAIAHLNIPADWIGIRAVKETASIHFVRDGLPKSNGKYLTTGAMLEVMVNGCLGYAATNSLSLPSLQTASQIAYKQALAASEWWIYKFNENTRPKVVGEYNSPFVEPFDAISPGEINDLLIRVCQKLKINDKIVQTTARINTSEKETWFVSSNGSEVYQKILSLGNHFGAIAQDGAIVQPRTNNGTEANSYQGGWELLKQDHLWSQVEKVSEQALELLTAPECPDTRTNLVLAPDQMMLQIHESVGHPLEIDRILGDERNYAGGSFVTKEDFGQLKYGSSLMNITFDPTVKGEFASYGFDDTGAVATKEYVIKEGILQRGLGSLESQSRADLPGVACARASSWNRPAIDRMANLNLEPGNATFDEMISGIEQGVYMESNRSWSIDDRRYKFQFGCEYAKLIENGKLTKTIRNPNYRATTPEFWHSLIQVGNADNWQMYGTPFCGKGEPNQAIWVGHGSPFCVFANVEVFGGG
ncbi:TldD/PmbA family protein [Anabaena cylindrica FACHB-243]|uniref:Peptidase U62 modulator of DNA gyrase n=1 Tax=Anabaena cylindrica (strain ATCC 27899 / PCC 7122) TaxID=272123 RepID=K9ZD15_ANACC|nr:MULTISPECIES: TldD/PmbA family protein [Anabaena]AFZ57076.1 peptidase U62 modulator of DNA gyrase [Anabaena cylindrica PCC 7122]MBD2421449.1 TldD/PmbA family protein [Anabaena cylindrica FACHB-243]MBY5284573.1 TldD/PmbA family protein [Anabaena sp. CCAP 1446/1C]MBY5310826.1 TldD/PmbA family protein [Anabaena sp. CCAP 1446/1C]MCM2407791.1 TldD/PmbA family protein [Anabaena sp. CCAP 1446/1C]